MYDQLASPQLQGEFRRLVKQAGAYTFHAPADEAARAVPWDYKTPHFFDLDRLWSEPHLLSQSSLLMEKAIEEAGLADFDTLVVPTSDLGSFGPVPQASILATRLAPPRALVVFREVEFGRFEPCPATWVTPSSRLAGARALIIKDIISGGWSVIQCANILAALRCEIVGVLLLIDLALRDRAQEWPDALRLAPRRAILGGPALDFAGL